MDLIVLAPPGARGEPPAEASLYGPGGGERLAELVSWLVEADEEGTGVDLYAVLPRGRGRREGCFAALAACLGTPAVEIYLLVTPEQLSRPLLARLESRGLHRVLVLADPAGHERTEAGLRTLADHLLAAPGSELRLGFWLPRGGDGASFRRIRSFLDHGIPSELVDAPLFTLAGAGTRAAPDVPADLVAGPSFCQIFANTLTVDPAGEVRFCPRDPGAPDRGGAEESLGNLFTDPPERILRRKGRQARRVGAMEMCIGCRARGRFAWPDRCGPAIGELYRAGMTWRGPWEPFRLADIRQLDVGSLPPEERDGEIRRFERRLHAWAARMDGIAEGAAGAGEGP